MKKKKEKIVNLKKGVSEWEVIRAQLGEKKIEACAKWLRKNTQEGSRTCAKYWN